MPDALSEALLHGGLDAIRIGLGHMLVLAGACIALVGSIGVLRFPDAYTRMHAVGVTDTAAAFLALSGMALIAGWSLVSVKLGLIFLFLSLTGPTATYAIANAALGSGLMPISGRWTGHASYTASDKPAA